MYMHKDQLLGPILNSFSFHSVLFLNYLFYTIATTTTRYLLYYFYILTKCAETILYIACVHWMFVVIVNDEKCSTKTLFSQQNVYINPNTIGCGGGEIYTMRRKIKGKVPVFAQ